jgi:hypothetical protein
MSLRLPLLPRRHPLQRGSSQKDILSRNAQVTHPTVVVYSILDGFAFQVFEEGIHALQSLQTCQVRVPLCIGADSPEAVHLAGLRTMLLSPSDSFYHCGVCGMASRYADLRTSGEEGVCWYSVASHRIELGHPIKENENPKTVGKTEGSIQNEALRGMADASLKSTRRCGQHVVTRSREPNASLIGRLYTNKQQS